MKPPSYFREANRRSYQKHKAERLAKQKSYRQTDLGKDTQARKDKVQQKKNPSHWSARSAVWRAVKRGSIEKPKLCKQYLCLNINVEAHHYLGYAKENWLDVIYLCRKHHIQAHNPELTKEKAV